MNGCGRATSCCSAAPRGAWRRAAAALLLIGAAIVGTPALAQGADPAQVDAGMKIYKTVGCDFCHGWAGNGGEAHGDHFGRIVDPGPSLVASKLSRAEMIEVISCGTPQSWMPQHLAAAWTPARRCYGKVAEDLAVDERPIKPGPSAPPPGPYFPLTQSQIEAVVAFVQEFYQGKGMNLDTCRKYAGPTSRACDLYR